MNNGTKDKKIKQLLELYFEGKTSSLQEEMLRDYFSGEDTDPGLDYYKSLFQYFKEERNLLRKQKEDLLKEANHPLFQVKRSRIEKSKRFIITLSVGTAACLAIFFSVKSNLVSKNSQTTASVVYIEGKKHLDMSSIRAELFHVLDNLEEENELIFSSQIDLLNDLLY